MSPRAKLLSGIGTTGTALWLLQDEGAVDAQATVTRRVSAQRLKCPIGCLLT